MDNPLSNLNMKWWHTVLLVASFTIFVLSLTVDMKISDNETIALISSGFFFISLGSFACQSFQQTFVDAPWGAKGIATKDKFIPNVPGVIMMIIGTILFFMGIF